MAQTFDGIRLEGAQAGSKSTENVVQQYLNSQRKNPDRKSAKSSLRTYERRDRRGRHTQVGEAPSKFALTRTATLYTMPQSQPALSAFPTFRLRVCLHWGSFSRETFSAEEEWQFASQLEFVVSAPL